jgi:threonine synthase
MRYLSTRGHAAPQSFCDILLGGLAPDGGLYLPESYPQIGRAELDAWRKLSYADLAYEILSKFITDIPAADLKALVAKTYTSQVYCHTRNGGDAAQITPLTKLEDGLYTQELSNGPTLAINILGATSGDTGSAAEYAMRGKHNVKVFMLSPDGKMSAFQRAQMYSLQDANIFNIAVTGLFDDAQDIVKAVSNDAAFKAKYKIGAVNSINWARVAAQIVYYFQGYFLATKSNDEQVAFAVPSGNFGNICAGHIARQMGLPIARLVLATNENDVLDEFFRSGVYRPRSSAETSITSSPSMDISKASNFERFVFDLVGRDPAVVAELWAKVDKGQAFDLNATVHWKNMPNFGFVSGKSTHADRLHTIRMAQQKYGVMLDTHTADGLKVALEHRLPNVPMIVLETAQPAKFEETIREALGTEPVRPADLAGIEKLPQRVVVMAPDVEAVKRYIVERV